MKNFRNNPFVTRRGLKKFSFKPTGKLVFQSGIRVNPVESWGKSLAVRMFVGLSVLTKGREVLPKYHVPDVIRLTREFLRAYTYISFRNKKGYSDPEKILLKMAENSSFITQRGVWTHLDYTPAKLPPIVVEEDSVQVIILNTGGMSRVSFLLAMQDLAEFLAKQLEQEVIVVEVQYAGVVEDTWGVTPS